MFLKHPNRLSFALKVAIVLLAAGYVVHRFFWTEDSAVLSGHFTGAVFNRPFLFCAVLLLMPLNWSLEAWKWKLAAGQLVPITFRRALKGVLAGVTIGTATPNRVGEFAGRIFMEKEADRVQLLFLSFVCSFCQVVVTFIAGLAGLAGMGAGAGIDRQWMVFIYIAGIAFCCLPLLLFVLPQKWKERTALLRKFPRGVFALELLLSAARYLVYVFQFVLLFEIFNPGDIPWWTVMNAVMVSYLVVTMIPTFAFLEVLVRGTIAGIMFEELSGSYETGVIVAVVLWTINVALPSLAGSVFVFRLKFFKQEK